MPARVPASAILGRVASHAPTAALLLAALTLALLGACAEIEVADDLPAATVAAPYEARLTIRGAHQPAYVHLYEGALPAGLVLAEDGTLHGEPLGIGAYPFTVRVVDATERWTLAPLTLEVADPAGVTYLGPILAEDDMNRLCLDGVDVPDQGHVHMMCLPWVRIAGGGMPDQTERPIRAGVLWVGPDGIADGGWGDDVLLRALDPGELAWSFEPGVSYPDHEGDGPNVPDDAGVDDAGVLYGGERTGPGTVQIAHPQHGTGAVEVLIVPPDFCPSPAGC